MPIVLFQGSLADVVEPPPPPTFAYGRGVGDVQAAVALVSGTNPAIGATGALGDTHGHGTGDGSVGRTGGSGAGPYRRRGGMT